MRVISQNSMEKDKNLLTNNMKGQNWYMNLKDIGNGSNKSLRNGKKWKIKGEQLNTNRKDRQLTIIEIIKIINLTITNHQISITICNTLKIKSINKLFKKSD